MGDISTNPATAQSLHSRFNHAVRFIFSPRRFTLALAGTCAVVGGAAALQAPANSTSDPKPSKQTFTVVPPSALPHVPNSSQTDAPSTTSSTTSTNLDVSATSGSNPTVQLNVNGQDITVPANGTTQQTITSPDGSSQTSVSASSSVSNQGDATNNASSSFTMNITSSSGASNP